MPAFFIVCFSKNTFYFCIYHVFWVITLLIQRTYLLDFPFCHTLNKYVQNVYKNQAITPFSPMSWNRLRRGVQWIYEPELVEDSKAAVSFGYIREFALMNSETFDSMHKSCSVSSQTKFPPWSRESWRQSFILLLPGSCLNKRQVGLIPVDGHIS